jgi:hypothetical protein
VPITRNVAHRRVGRAMLSADRLENFRLPRPGRGLDAA